MSKILVTGGTGLVGSHLLYHLTQQGCSPIAIKRKESDIQNVNKIFRYYSSKHNILFNKISWVECDILDLLKLENIIESTEYIYHCAAFISFNNSDKEKMLNVNTTGTTNIIDLSLKHNIKRLCFVSSIATLGVNNNLPVHENCIWQWKDQSGYAISKYLAEIEVWRGFAEGLSGFIVNPSLIIGPGSWESGIGTIIQKIKWGLPFYPNGSCGLIDVSDLAKIMVKLMNSDITNERFIINAEHMSYKQLMCTVANSLHRPPPFIKTPNWLMKLFIYLDIFISKIRGRRIELSTDAIKHTTSNIILDTSKINQTINFQYNSIEESLKNCVKIFNNNT